MLKLFIIWLVGFLVWNFRLELSFGKDYIIQQGEWHSRDVCLLISKWYKHPCLSLLLLSVQIQIPNHKLLWMVKELRTINIANYIPFIGGTRYLYSTRKWRTLHSWCHIDCVSPQIISKLIVLIRAIISTVSTYLFRSNYSCYYTTSIDSNSYIDIRMITLFVLIVFPYDWERINSKSKHSLWMIW